MGVCCSSTATTNVDGSGGSSSSGAIRSRELDKLIKEDERRQAREVKLLLLGAGDSGKSTILKSMRLIHNIDFTAQERESYRRQVFQNVCTGMKQLLEIMAELEQSLEHPDYELFFSLFVTLPDIGEGEAFPSSFLEPLQLLWQDTGVQAAHSRGPEFALPDNLPYFYSHLHRLFASDYTPTDADILHCRNKTSGIIETIFPLREHVYRIFDVGGQRSERKKWIHCFENVTAVLFIVALSGYDCCLVEDQRSNQMHEALMLFDSICNSKWFLRTSFILFLNKVDIFEQKASRSSEGLRICFPDYAGEEGDVEEAKAYIRARFLQLNRSQTKDVYCSFTNATDPALLKIVMASVTDTILTRSLRDNLL